jgi:F-type H+-transporting ATPase subunit b
LRRILILVAALSLPLLAAAEHGDSGHADLGMWKWANFALLAAGIAWAVAKHAPAFFAGRTAEIRKSLEDAAKVKQDADARAAEIEKRIANLSAEVGALRDASKREMEAEAARARDEAERVMAKMEESARREVESMSKQAQQELRQHAARLALDLAEQRVRAGLDSKAQGALATRFIADLGRGSNN